MSGTSVCRVCLVDDMNLYRVRNDLQNVYERIVREKYNKIGYPVHMCCICLTVLQKCQRFMKTAQDTNNVLKKWYNKQNEMRAARPLYTYSKSKAELVSIYNENLSLLSDVKSELEEDRSEYPEYNTDVIEKTDKDEQSDNSELLLDIPDDSTYTDTTEDDNDRQTDPLYNSEIDFEETSSLASNLNNLTEIETSVKIISEHDNDLPSIRKHETDESRPQHQAPETSRDTAAHNEISNGITPLNGTPSIQGCNVVRCRSSKETAKLGKVVKAKLIRKKNINERLVTNTLKNSQHINKSALSATFIEKNEKNKINAIPLGTANNSILNTKTKECIDLYKYCEVCNFKCTTKDVLAEHMRLHDDSKPKVCDVCGCRFTCLSSLNKHKATAHGMNTNKEYCCNNCDYKTTVRSYLIRHIKHHTAEKQFPCDICDYKFKQKCNLQRHMRTHTGDNQFSCDICEYKCKQKVHLDLHTRSHTGEKPFACNICESKYTSKQGLKKHMTSHTGKNSFACNICGSKYTSQQSLKLHMGSHVGETPYFACNICESKCASKQGLKLHMRIHTGEKPYSCENCDYKCAYKGGLVIHMRSHTGEKPFSCNICDYRCTQKTSLTTHMRTHTGAKLFSCDICESKFTTKQSLKWHIRIHTGEKPFTCEICDYKCIQKGSLVTHMRTHTGDKPFLCHMCSHRFIRKADFRSHLRTHTDEKPFACDSCDYKCTQKGCLERHVTRTHTGGQSVGVRRGNPRL